MKKQKWLLYIIPIMVVLTGVLSFRIMEEDKEINKQKVVTSINIEYGDSIWNIAREYFQAENQNLESYVKEIKKCNNMSSDKIYAGQNLIIPYYE